MAFSYLRGHKIEFVDGEWIYCDTKEPTSKTFEARSCGYCNQLQTENGHDACFGELMRHMFNF